MINNKKVLVIVPARSGSKGLKDKNILEIHGKPLLAWPINAALKSKYVDEVVLSTDSETYKQIGLEQGAKVPFLRPVEFSGDNIESIDVIFHCIEWFEDQSMVFDILVLLEPTSPMTETIDIDNALEKLLSSPSSTSIVGVSKAECNHPIFAYKKAESSLLEPFINQTGQAIRRQELDDAFYLDGSLYISCIKALKKEKTFYTESTMGFEFPKWKAFEIDDEIDFEIVELLMKKYSNDRL
jgi:CMP-N,N'-diacetyllegionaminic acid synthase